MNRYLSVIAGSVVAVASSASVVHAGSPALYRSGEVLVKYRDDAKAAASAATKASYGMQTKDSLMEGRVELLSLPSMTDVPSAIAMLQSDPTVEYAEPNFIRRASSVTPNDPLFPQQWGLSNTGQANFVDGGPAGIPGGDLNSINGWDLDGDGTADHTGRGNVVVAIVDDGFEISHADLAANMLTSGYNFADGNSDVTPKPTKDDDQSHGTKVAGCVAAVGNNGIGVAGAAWNEKMLPIKFDYDVASEVKALQYAQSHGAKIVNASFGGPSYTRTEYDAISALNDAGILFVASAGNENSNNDFAGAAYPANYQLPNIVAVAATNRQDDIASFSSYGSVTVPVAAPGLQIVTTNTGGGYTTDGVAGTSFSSPYAAGVSALILDYISGATVSELKARLIEGANRGVDPSNLNGLRVAGGRIDTKRSLSLAAQPSLVIKPVQTSTYTENYGSGSETIPVFSSVTVNDGGNKTLDPGETTNIGITVENLWQAATNVSGTLTVAGSAVTSNSGAVSFGNIASQGSATAQFGVTVAPDAAGHQYVYFTLNLRADGGYAASRSFILEIGTLASGVTQTQAIGTDLYDEFHTWHVDVPASSTLRTLTFTTTADKNVDIIVRRGEPAQYSISLGAATDLKTAFYFYDTDDNLVAKDASGNETINIANPAAGTYFVTVVNYDQTNTGYTLRADLVDSPLTSTPASNSNGSSGGGSAPPLLLLAGLMAARARRRRKAA